MKVTRGNRQRPFKDKSHDDDDYDDVKSSNDGLEVGCVRGVGLHFDDCTFSSFVSVTSVNRLVLADGWS